MKVSSHSSSNKILSFYVMSLLIYRCRSALFRPPTADAYLTQESFSQLHRSHITAGPWQSCIASSLSCLTCSAQRCWISHTKMVPTRKAW